MVDNTCKLTILNIIQYEMLTGNTRSISSIPRTVQVHW